jgi:hypothetical protein
MARWYEANSDRLYLPPNLEHLPGVGRLSRHDITALLGFRNHNSVHYFLKTQGIRMRNGPVSFEAIEHIVLNMLPRGFPWLSKELGVKYSEALFVVPVNLLDAIKGASPIMFQAVNVAMVNGYLSGPGSVFVQHGCQDEKGNRSA